MRNVLVLAGMFASSIGVLGGCGDDEAPSYSGGPVSKSELPGTLANVFCKTLKPCCDSAASAFDMDACESTFSFVLADMLSSADASKYSYDADAAGACLGTLQDTSLCSAETEPLAADALCSDAFQGAVPPGGACNADIECAADADADAMCDLGADGGQGTCSVETTAGLGDACYWTCTAEGASRECFASGRGAGEPAVRPRCFTNDGLYCASDGLCTAQVGLDAPCEQHDDCVERLFCDSSAGVCSALLARGEPCSFEGCDEGLYCSNGTCTPQLAAGVACDPLQDECSGGFCDEGTCVAGGGLSDLGATLLCGVAGGGQQS